MPRLTVQIDYNNEPITVKVLYNKYEGIFDSPEPDIEIISAYSKGKKALDIEELSEDEEFLYNLREEIESISNNTMDDEEENNDSED